MDENSLATEVIGAAIEVHRALGPGLLESAYHECLVHELELRKLTFEKEVPIALDYKGVVVGVAYRADLLVGNKLLVELKTVDRLLPVHKAQLVTYLRLTNRKLGLLINFNVTVLKDGIQRVAFNL
jgi:GxxExxY protein